MYLRILTLVLLFSFCKQIEVYSQSAGKYTSKIEALKTEARILMMTDMDSSLSVYRTIENLASEKLDSAALFSAIFFQASLENFRNDRALALHHINRAYPFSRTAQDSMSSLILFASIVDQDNMEKADSVCLEAEKMIDRVSNPTSTISVYFLLSNTKFSSGQFHKSIEYSLKVLDIEEINDFQKANAYRKMARVFLILGNKELTKQYIDLATDIEEENNYKTRYQLSSIIKTQLLLDLNEIEAAQNEAEATRQFLDNGRDYLAQMRNYNILASIDIKKQKWKSAENNLFQAFLYNDSFNQSGIVNFIPLLMNQCEINLHHNKHDNVITTAEKIIELTRDFNSPVFKKQALVYKQRALDEIGNINGAYQNLITIKSIEDSLFKRDKIFMTNYLETQFNRKEQESAIALLDTKNELQTNQLSQQRNLLVIGGIAFLIVSFLSFFLYRLFKKVASQKMLLSKALNEKDTLLREIHHRVKNNLQLVSSLLGLQSQYIQDPGALDALNSGKARVKSMALIHQDLYNKENLRGVSVKDYLHKLSVELITTYQVNQENIELQTDIPDMLLDVDTLIPLGLIINELLTNSLKYAFPNNRSGKILIKIYEDSNGLRLDFSDDGIGIDPNKKTTTSFGYKLIETLLEQLEGEMHQKNNNGTQLFFTFTDYKIAA